METLWNLYQQRLNALNTQFIDLLSQFQNNHLLTNPQLAKYRLEYLASILHQTLTNNQEKLILKLYHQIDQLKLHNQKLILQISDSNKTLDHSNDEFEFREKSLGSTKVSTVCYRRDKEETDSFMDSCSSKFGKRTDTKGQSGAKGKQKQFTRTVCKKNSKKDDNINSAEQDEEMEMMKMSFKYLKF